MTASNGRSDGSLKRAKTPVGAGAQPVLGIIWSSTVLAVGIVCVRDALVHAGALSGQPWLETAATRLDGETAQDWMVPVGVGVAVLGLFLLVGAFRRRPRRGVRLTASTGVYLTSSSVRRLAKAAAAGVDGVDTTAVSANRRKVRVDATTFTAQPEQTKQRIEDALRSQLAALETTPDIRVRVQTAEGLT